MSTRSLIGKEIAGGKVEYIYCHCGGDIECNGEILKHDYNYETVSELLELGSMSILSETVNDCVFYTRDMNREFEESEIIDLETYFSEGDILWTEFRYLYTRDGNLLCYYENEVIQLYI